MAIIPVVNALRPNRHYPQVALVVVWFDCHSFMFEPFNLGDVGLHIYIYLVHTQRHYEALPGDSGI